MGDDELQAVVYQRETSEICWMHVEDAGWTTTEFAGGETLHEPVYETLERRVLATVDPPYK